jgi:catechol 2,3-dioxygenase-like lactoylglutathione lyase family enzyme
VPPSVLDGIVRGSTGSGPVASVRHRGSLQIRHDCSIRAALKDFADDHVENPVGSSLRVDRQDEHRRMDPMSHVRRFDHVGITVADLNTSTAFFVGLGLEVEGTRMFVEGEFLDTVIGIPDSRTEIVMLRPPDGGTRLELSSFVRPDHQPGSPAAMANELGLRNVAFEVDDLQAAVDRLAADGYGLVGDIGQYEHIWRMAYVRGPEGIIVSLSERIG